MEKRLIVLDVQSDKEEVYVLIVFIYLSAQVPLNYVQH